MSSAIWPEEYEEHRKEALVMAGAIKEMLAAADLPTDPLEQIAARRRAMTALEVPSDAAVEELVAGVPCRVFRPEGESRGTYLHFHGGAMILGSARLNDVPNAQLSRDLGVTVISVDYRLAPEHPFPAGSDDCLAVAAHVVREERAPIAVGGESAGAYFAALTLLRLRDRSGGLAGVTGANLVFGIYDLSGTPSGRGVRPCDADDVLDDDIADMVIEHYLPGRSREDARDPAVSPLYADLTGMPPALFTVGSGDHLLDDSLFMAARWQAYGSRAELAVYPDCVHGFIGFPMELARRANARIGAFLGEVLGSPQADSS